MVTPTRALKNGPGSMFTLATLSEVCIGLEGRLDVPCQRHKYARIYIDSLDSYHSYISYIPDHMLSKMKLCDDDSGDPESLKYH